MKKAHHFSYNQGIINMLLLNASFINNLGLMHGKMGISILFFHLARKYENKIYEDYAGELIDEIYEEITIDTPVDFENGLAGIGWGIEYLVQNKFIDADTDEVLEEFDNRIFKELINYTPDEIGLLNGLVGIGTYFLKRMQNSASNKERITKLTNKQILIHLIDELEHRTLDVRAILIEPDARTANLEQPNSETKETFEPKPCFNITWNYPVLIWFLAELHQQKIVNFKIEKLIRRLIEPLTNSNNLPKLQSNRLLLALALTKLMHTQDSLNSQTHDLTVKNSDTDTVEQNKNKALSSLIYNILELSNIKTITTKLLNGINRNVIAIELPPNNTNIKHGTSGIFWIYKQLFELTTDKWFKQEMEHWAIQCLPTESEVNNYREFYDFANHKATAFGILEGNAGKLYTNH